ncbi:site-specific integrase [Enterococcus mundtii]|uniref:tyrosine-type recombinase/integrase n=1 Tax=Enterococcus TaxID=1350 RepID=UPI002543B1B7|nr:site-specific integrase [Enterococcus mundtii]MDK4212310.1 site-specific integrase [Enterococcus mundtii]
MTVINKYKKKDGKTYYQFKLYVGSTPDGKKNYIQRRGFESEKIAKIALSRLMIDVEENGYKKKVSETFESVYKQWFENVHSRQVRNVTASRTKDMFRLHILPALGDKQISKITPQMCYEQVTVWSEYYKKYKTLKAYTQSVFAYAISIGLIKDNPMKVILMPKRQPNLEDKKENFYSATELSNFLSLLKNQSPVIFSIFHTLAYTGMRKGELLALNWSDIDFKNKTLSITKSLTNLNHEPILSLPKNDFSIRTIGLDDVTIKVLKDWKIEQEKQYFNFKVTSPEKEDNPVFTRVHYDGTIKRCYLDYPNNFLKKFFKDHPEIKKISPHGFRHTHVTLLFESGASIKEVQERVGHSPNDLSVTIGIYQHITNRKKEESVDRFSNYIEQEKTNEKTNEKKDTFS